MVLATWIGVFVYNNKTNSTYGFFSTTKPLTFRVSTEKTKLVLDFAPGESGFGMLELDLARDSTDSTGFIFAQVTDEETKRVLSSEKYSTVHVDNSRPLLISLGGARNLKSNIYKLTIRTTPPVLIAEYLVQKGLHLQGVFFIDKNTLLRDYTQVFRLAGWKAQEVGRSYEAYQLLALAIVPLLLPLIIFLSYKESRQRKFAHLVSTTIVRFFCWLPERISNLQKLGKEYPTYGYMRLITSYSILFNTMRHNALDLWTMWYGANTRFFWDAFLVLMWVSSNLVFAVSSIELLNEHYLWFIGLYVVFSIARRVDPRAHYFGALVSLILCPYYLSIGKESIAEKTAIFVYFFMVFGAITDAVTILRERRKKSDSS